VLAIPASLELPGDAVHPVLEPLLALGELALALRQTPGRLRELALHLVQVLERLGAVALALFDRLPVEHPRSPEWERSTRR
jgi:hypothetical protein